MYTTASDRDRGQGGAQDTPPRLSRADATSKCIRSVIREFLARAQGRRLLRTSSTKAMQSPQADTQNVDAILKNLFPDGAPPASILGKRARSGDADDTWKMLTYRYSLNLSQCKACRDDFYKHRATRIQKKDSGGCQVTLDFCKACTEGNIRMSGNYYASFADKKQQPATANSA